MHVTPRAAADEVVGVDEDGVLRLRVRALPADGKANDAVRRVIAKALGIGVTRVTIERGLTSRVKQVSVQDVEPSDVARRWPGLRMR